MTAKFKGNRKKTHGGTSFFPKSPRAVVHIFENGEALCGNPRDANEGPFTLSKADIEKSKHAPVNHFAWKLEVCSRCRTSYLD